MNVKPTKMRIDASVFFGDYPFRGLPQTLPRKWKELAARYEITRAAASSFQEVFWENNYDAAERLADDLRADNVSDGLTHFVVVNPAYPRQIQDLPKLIETTGASGVRLFPNYHSYRLWEPCVQELFEVAAGLHLPIQIFREIQDERLQWLLKVPSVDSADFQWLVSSPPPCNVLVSGLDFNAIVTLGNRLNDSSTIWFDLSRVRGPVFAVEKLIERIGANKLVFGSLWPLQNIASSFRQIEEAKITEEQKAKVLGGSWAQFANALD